MSVKSTEEYFELLKKSGVLSPSELDDVKIIFAESADPREVARQLVNQEILTDWQARFLMSGRHGLHVGQYRLVDRLPKHASGDLFLAVHQKLDRTVNILILPRRANENQKVLQKFLEQAAIVAELDHPNLLHVYDIDKENDRYVVVLENQTGVALNNLPPKSLTAQEVARITSEALAGVLYAHERGLLHGKLDESQICVGPKHSVKILGFGVAKLLDQLADPEGEADEFAIETDASDDLAALGRTAKVLYRNQIGQPLTAPQKDLFAILSDLENVTNVRHNPPQDLVKKINSWIKVQQQATQPSTTPQQQPKRSPGKTKAGGQATANQRANQKLWIVVAAGFLVIGAIGLWYLLSGSDSETVAQKTPPEQQTTESESQDPSAKESPDAGLSPRLPELPESGKAKQKTKSAVKREDAPKQPSSEGALNSGQAKKSNPDIGKKTTTNNPDPTPETKPKTPPSPVGQASTSSATQFAVNVDVSGLAGNNNSILLNATKKLNIEDPVIKRGEKGYPGPDLYLAIQKAGDVDASGGVAIPPESGYRLRFNKGVAGQRAFALHAFKVNPIDLTGGVSSDEVGLQIRGLKKGKFNNAHVRFVIRDGERFYVSDASENLNLRDGEYINADIKKNVLAMDWYAFDPVQGQLDNFSGPLQKPALNQVNFVGFLLCAERSTPAQGGANFGVRVFQAFKGPAPAMAAKDDQEATEPTAPSAMAAKEPQEASEPTVPPKVYLEGSEGLPLVSWDKAAKSDGQEIVVYGNVVSVRSSSTGKTRYLEFVKGEPQRFRIAVKQSELSIAESVLTEKFLGKAICVRGEVQLFMQKFPEILLKDLKQIVVVDQLPGPNTKLASQAPREFNTVAKNGAFAGMPPGVSIPEINRSAIETKPVPLGPVKVGDDPIGLFLTVPDIASPKPMSLKISRDPSGKRWEISHAGKSNAAETDFQSVAEIHFREDQLFFNWLPSESPNTNLNYLQNCLLEIKTPDESKTILLRKPVVGKPIRLDEKRGISKEKVELNYLPKPEAISIEFLGLSKDQFPDQISETGMTASLETPETILYFDLLLQNRFFRLIHDVDINRQIKIDSALQINLPQKPLAFTSRNVRDLDKNLKQRQVQINRTNEAALQYNPPDGEKMKHKDRLKTLSKELEMINGQALAFQTSLPVAEAALKAEMKYRIYFTVGDAQFNLLIPETASENN